MRTKTLVPSFISSWLSAVAVALLALSGAQAQEFDAQPLDAGEPVERQTGSSGKIPRLDDAIRTEDGKVRVIVQFTDPSVVQHLRATSSSTTHGSGSGKVDFNSAAARSYRGYLQKSRGSIERQCQTVAPSAVAIADHFELINGMTLAVNESEIPALAALPQIKKIYPDRMYHQSMDASLPLINAPEFWKELGGRDNAGAGIKVAVIDGGIRPDNPMFDGTGFSFPPGYPLVDDYCGAVDPMFCNGKLIAARHFRTVPLHPAEFDTPLGANGHGTHVAGSAVGNFVAGATAPDGVPEDISGVAPGAWLLAYKALWWNGVTGSGSATDLINALVAAVLDGADVINNSWGGSAGLDPALDIFGPVFEFVRMAGVVNVVAAGNSGPGPQTIGCPGCQPAALTVAASTTNRIHALGFSVGDKGDGVSDAPCVEGTGPALGGPIGPQDVVYAGDVGDPEGCAAFPAASMTGAIALISRGSCTFATKEANATAAGADYMVVFNNVGGAPIIMGALAGPISSCMISNGDGMAASAFVQANPGADGEVSHPASRQTNDAFQDHIASFSSRGPNGDPDLLKPDIAAPGVRILSAWSPDDPSAPSIFRIIQGTSMASPHVAGAAALMLQKHPTWSPDQVKTALTSTSVRGLVKEDAMTPADPFDRGAGRLDLDRARNAGATFDEVGMAEDFCFGNCSFTRTMQNELPSTTDWCASTESVDPNLGITVTPDMLTLAPGGSAPFNVDVNTVFAAQSQWQFGGVTWSPCGGKGKDDAPDAFLPIAVFAEASTDTMQLTKTVDKAAATGGERLTYDIKLSNFTLANPINLVDFIPAGTTFVPGSELALVNGVPDPTFTYNAGPDNLTWSGMLDPLTLQLIPGPSPFGYVPLSIFVPPLPCSSVCDDTFISLGGIPSFDYAGATYNDVVMSTNGFFVAGTDTTSAFTFANQNLPDPTPPNNVIAPFWTDIDMDGTSPTDTGAGIWYAALLTSGPQTYLVLEWEGVELFGAPGPTFTFQVWIELGTSNISIVYASIPGIPPFLTTGVEDQPGTGGSSYFFDGAGVPPIQGPAGDLVVDFTAGGMAEFTFQVDTDCDADDVLNVVDVISGVEFLQAFAGTQITPAGGDDDKDGVPNCRDVCPGTKIPESVPTRRLYPDFYALTDNDLIFDTGPKTKSPLSITTEDTAGCSCEQIIDQLNLTHPGYRRYGCARNKMLLWMRRVNN